MIPLDMTASTEARSDQINAVDLSAPRTYTIEKVTAGKATHPFDFHLVESPGKVFRPNLGMRRVIMAGWGPKTEVYHGRRLTLFNEPTVIYAGAEIGGIRVSHMSHLDKPLKTSLAISQKKKVPYTVQPLIEVDTPPAQREPTAKEIAACTDTETLTAMWKASGKERRVLIEARVAEIGATNARAIEAPVDKATGEIVDDPNPQWDEASE